MENAERAVSAETPNFLTEYNVEKQRTVKKKKKIIIVNHYKVIYHDPGRRDVLHKDLYRLDIINKFNLMATAYKFGHLKS